ncbi:MAG: DUF502 domain-containing protein [Verrucomicrobiota bacterium]|nr:DUF502 domain-containing protein [Verrucomicrobiota bacterium]
MNKLFTHYRNNFFAGLILTFPLVGSVGITYWLFNVLTSYIPVLLEKIDHPYIKSLLDIPFLTTGLRFLSLFMAFFIIYLIGLFTKNVIGAKIVEVWEKLLLKVPFINTIYSTIQQIGKAIFSNNTTKMFSEVVLIEYPKKKSYVIAFKTANGPEELLEKTGKNLVSLFVPTTPNPTSGFLLFLPEKEITVLDMTVAEGMRLVISGGVVKPQRKTK